MEPLPIGADMHTTEKIQRSATTLAIPLFKQSSFHKRLSILIHLIYNIIIKGESHYELNLCMPLSTLARITQFLTMIINAI